MTQEELQKILESAGLNGEWIKFDKHDFSRTLEFSALEEKFEIEWWVNQSYLKKENLMIPFTEIKFLYTWPTYWHKQLQFYNNKEIVAVIGTKRRD